MAALCNFFFVPNGSPNLITWPSGVVPVTIYAKVESPVSGQTYTVVPRLLRGQHQGSWVSYDTGTGSSGSGPWDPAVTPQVLTTSWTLYTFYVPVQALSGLTSDRFFLEVIGSSDDAGLGGIIHVGSDGGSNQTMASPLFDSSPYSPPTLARNPDSGRPTQAIATALTGSSLIRNFYSRAGDPNLVIWPARTWRLRIWAKVDSGSATLSASVGRQPVGGGFPTEFASHVVVGIVTATSWTLYKVDVPVPESSGDVGDTIYVGLEAAASSSVTISVSVGLNFPSSLNVPLLSPSSGTVAAPTDDHKVSVESGSTPGYLSEVVQSADASIMTSVDPGTHKLDLRVVSRTSTAIRSIYIPAAELAMDGAALKSHTMLGTLGQRTDSIALPHGSTNGVSASVVFPENTVYGPVTIRPVWAPGVSSSGAVRWSAYLQIDGIDITWTPTPTTWTGDAGAKVIGVPRKESGVASSWNASPGGWARIGLYRIGGDSLDTYTGAVDLLGIEIDYTKTVRGGA